MLKQILCCSLLIGQLCAGEHPRTPLPNDLNATEVSAAFMKRFPGVPNLLEGISQNSGAIALPVAQAPTFPVPILGGSHSVRMSAAGQPSNLQGMLQSPQGLLLNSPFLMSGGNQVEGTIDPSVDPGPEVPSSDSTQEEATTVLDESDTGSTPGFRNAEDAGIFQYLRAHPGKPNWNACLERLVWQGIIAPGARTAGQLKDKYHYDLKNRPEFAAVSHMENAPRFTAAEDAGIMQYVRAHPGRQNQNWDACLKTLTEQGIIAPRARTAKQLMIRYNGSLKTADERKKLAPDFTTKEDEALLQYVQDHPRKKQNWEECLKDLTDQGMIAPGSRTASQLKARYNGGLKSADERTNYAPRFTAEEDEALQQIIREYPNLSWNDMAKLFAEAGVSEPGVQRTAAQLSCRYNNNLKSAGERGKGPSRFTTEEDEALKQIVAEHPELSWEERANLFAEMMRDKSDVQRTANQLNKRYNGHLKGADERKKFAPKFTAEEDEELIQIVHENPKLGWEERADLFAEMMKDKSDVQRTANQIKNRYNGTLRARTGFAAADERRSYAPRFTAAEETGILRYLQANPGRPNWNACLEQLIEQGIIAPGARTAKQLMRRFNYLRHRLDDEAKSSDSDSDEEEGA